MYVKPNLSDPVEKLAHFLSEIHNNNAPIGWESYKNVARELIQLFGIEEDVIGLEL